MTDQEKKSFILAVKGKKIKNINWDYAEAFTPDGTFADYWFNGETLWNSGSIGQNDSWAFGRGLVKDGGEWEFCEETPDSEQIIEPFSISTPLDFKHFTKTLDKKCTCPWNLINRGCECGAITPWEAKNA